MIVQWFCWTGVCMFWLLTIQGLSYCEVSAYFVIRRSNWHLRAHRGSDWYLW